jgi:hypothetical protein
MFYNPHLPETDFYCADCQTITRQVYKGLLANNSRLFLCRRCGCENYDDTVDESYENYLKEIGIDNFAL